MRNPDLRLRIAIAIAAVCISLLTVIGITLYVSSEKLEAALVNQLVDEELNFLIRHRLENPAYVPQAGKNVEYYVLEKNGKSALPAYAQNLSPGKHEIDIGEGRGERTIAIQEIDGTRFVVIYNVGLYEVREREFKSLVMASLFIVAILALFLGRLLSGFLTKQLTGLANKVSMLSFQESTTPLYSDSLDHEVGVLAKAIDSYRLRIADMLRREQEFTANVSHELRTPLTAIRTSCELLAREAAWSDKTRARIRYIAKAEQDMREQMEVLLFLARDQTGENDEAVALHECVQDAVRMFEDEIAEKGLLLLLHIDPEATAILNRKALHLVLVNLVKNAIAFTDDGKIELSFDGKQLRIADTGIGIDEKDIPRIFDRSYRAGDQTNDTTTDRTSSRTDGLGLGLHIVRRVCEHESWTIDVSSTLAGGTTFSLGFAATPKATLSVDD